MKNLRVSQMLGLAFGVLVLLLAAVSVIASFSLSGLNNACTSLGEDRVPKLIQISAWGDAIGNVARSQRNMLIYDPDKVAAEYAKLDAAEEQARKIEEFFAKNVKSPDGIRLIGQIEEKTKNYFDANAQMVAAVKAGHMAEAKQLMLNKALPAQRDVVKLFDDLKIEQQALAKHAVEIAESDYKTGNTSLVVASLIAVLAAVAMAIFITRHLTGILGGEPAHAAQVARTIADGDLTRTIPVKQGDASSMMAAMNTMQTSLRGLISHSLDASNQLASAAHQLATTSEQVAQGSAQQSESAASMAAAVEELTVSINHVSKSANDAQSLASEAGGHSREGAMLVQTSVAEINRMAESVAHTAQQITHLGEQSEKISGIVNVIKEIADQTNLLALNAAIEAARAGEQGRGFAVVADEVRKLAERTTQSTQEIAGMIGDMQLGTTAAVTSMSAGREQVAQGVVVVQQSGTAISRIETGTGSLLTAVDEISAALKEQSAASNEIAINVERIAQMTEENSTAVNTVSESAHHLEVLAHGLQQQVGRFRV